MKRIEVPVKTEQRGTVPPQSLCVQLACFSLLEHLGKILLESVLPGAGERERDREWIV
jgi:hypothetical protein